jgi:hypothetical protein
VAQGIGPEFKPQYHKKKKKKKKERKKRKESTFSDLRGSDREDYSSKPIWAKS